MSFDQLQFHKWSKIYKEHVPKTISIALSKEFIDFLLQDSIKIPNFFFK